MTLNEIIDMQKKFDSDHASRFNWDEKITDNNIETLEYLLLCLVGEFGETANIVKKTLRGDYRLNDVRGQLSEEVIDVFIYIIKLAYQLEIDIEQEYIKKLERNKLRFKGFIKDGVDRSNE